MKGRRPHLRAVQGGMATGSLPAPPDGLCEHGRAEWTRIIRILDERGLYGGDLLATLEGYCRAVGLGRRYAAMLDAEGHVVAGKSHPAFKMLMGAAREERLLAAELGLTPQRRGRQADKAPASKFGADLA